MMADTSKGYHRNSVLLRVGTDVDFVLAQARRAPSERTISVSGVEPYELISSCLMSLRTGECLQKSQILPRITTIENGRALMVEEVMFPVARLLEIRYLTPSADPRREASHDR